MPFQERTRIILICSPQVVAEAEQQRQQSSDRELAWEF